MRTRGFFDWKPRQLPIVAACLVAGLGGAIALAAFGSGCSWFGSAGTATGPNTSWFVDITNESGLDFVHDAGPVGSYFLPQLMASGVALFDFDGDGLLDIYLIHNGGPNGKKNQL